MIARPLITGASRGIGRAFVDEFLAAGAETIYAAVRNEAAKAALAAVDPRISPLILDITKPDQVAAAAATATDITVLVNNAGVEMQSGLLSAPDMTAARLEMEVNYFGPLAMARAFAPVLKQRGGAMVNILSISALVNVPRVGSYSASKAAARSMTQGLRAELQPEGVRVIAVYPAGYDTDMASYVKDTASLFPPRMLTSAVLKSLRNGGPDDLYPDPASAHIERLSREDPDGLVAMFAAVREA